MQADREEAFERIQSAIDYRFVDRAFLMAATTHRSYVNEARDRSIQDNQRLEFFGDAVLGFLVSRRLFDLFPTSSEGSLSRVRASIVDEETLARVARRIRLGDCLSLGRGEEMSGGREKKSILADACEALVAAVYLDGGTGAAEQLVDRLFGHLLDEAASGCAGRDFKTRLQEESQALCGAAPSYRLDGASGPDHERLFSVTVCIGGKAFGTGTGRNKKEAEQAAAREALTRLESGSRPETS